MSDVKVSIVIPCRNGAAVLERQLTALREQSTDLTFEIIVADNGSSDGTRALVEKVAGLDPRVRLVDAGRHPGINTGRNCGIRSARGHFILLCDADDRVGTKWVEPMVLALAQGADCVGGTSEYVLPDGRSLGRRSGLVKSEYSSIPYPLGANCGFRREVFDEVGGFDEEIKGGSDEADFFWRAAALGYSIVHVDEARIEYTQRLRLRDVFAQYRAYGRGHVRTFRKHAEEVHITSDGSVRLLRSLPAIAKILLPARKFSLRQRVELAGFLAGGIQESRRRAEFL